MQTRNCMERTAGRTEQIGVAGLRCRRHVRGRNAARGPGGDSAARDLYQNKVNRGDSRDSQDLHRDFFRNPEKVDNSNRYSTGMDSCGQPAGVNSKSFECGARNWERDRMYESYDNSTNLNFESGMRNSRCFGRPIQPDHTQSQWIKLVGAVLSGQSRTTEAPARRRRSQEGPARSKQVKPVKPVKPGPAEHMIRENGQNCSEPNEAVRRLTLETI
jgi:hypothetical protein